MTYVDDRSPAFEPGEYDSVGLTKREYFAAMAMQGILSDAASVTSLIETTPKGKRPTEEAAKLYVECADALLAALNQKGDSDHE